MINYHADMEAAVSDLIYLHFRNPEAYDVERASFQTRIQIARALIGPTPDDDVWDIVKAFSSLRNTLAHSSTAYTEEGIGKTKRQTQDILKALQKVRPEYTDEAANDKAFIIAWAAMTVHGFFREIREALSRNDSSVQHDRSQISCSTSDSAPRKDLRADSKKPIGTRSSPTTHKLKCVAKTRHWRHVAANLPDGMLEPERFPNGC